MPDSLKNNNASFTPACKSGIDTRRRVAQLEVSVEQHWSSIEQLRNRLPAWAMLLISLLTFLLGITLAWAGLLQSRLLQN